MVGAPVGRTIATRTRLAIGRYSLFPPLQTPALGKIRHDVCLRCRGDLGKELRKKNPDPHFLQNHHQWLKRFGREKVHDQVTTVVTIMRLCENMDDFKQKFARLFNKSSPQMEFTFAR